MATPPPTWNIGSVERRSSSSMNSSQSKPDTSHPNDVYIRPNSPCTKGVTLGFMRRLQRSHSLNVVKFQLDSKLSPRRSMSLPSRDQSNCPKMSRLGVIGPATSTLKPSGELRLSSTNTSTSSSTSNHIVWN